jgi:phosphatidate cytidylyltransferase
MLKQRLITAAILIPLVVWAILSLQSTAVFICFSVVAALAAWEWLGLMGVSHTAYKTLLLLVWLVSSYLLLMFLPIQALMSLGLSIWLLATLLVVFFAGRPLSQNLTQLFRMRLFGLIIMILVLAAFVGSAAILHSRGPALLLFVMVSVWLADTGGYFAGKRYGKHKLAKTISPNKTWEGVAGALILALAWAGGFYFVVDGLTVSLPGWLALTAFVVMVSIVGDLFESVFKRCFDVKDSGQMLPGHGGILDRIDSLLAAVPVFTASLLVLGAA